MSAMPHPHSHPATAQPVTASIERRLARLRTVAGRPADDDTLDLPVAELDVEDIDRRLERLRMVVEARTAAVGDRHDH